MMSFACYFVVLPLLPCLFMKEICFGCVFSVIHLSLVSIGFSCYIYVKSSSGTLSSTK